MEIKIWGRTHEDDVFENSLFNCLKVKKIYNEGGVVRIHRKADVGHGSA